MKKIFFILTLILTTMIIFCEEEVEITGIVLDCSKPNPQPVVLKQKISKTQYEQQLLEAQRIQQEIELKKLIEQEKQKILEEQAIQRLIDKGIIIQR